jgi:hypothetical protein
MWNRKQELFDAAPKGLIDELRRRGYDVDDKSSTEVVRLIMKGELRKECAGWANNDSPMDSSVKSESYQR